MSENENEQLKLTEEERKYIIAVRTLKEENARLKAELEKD